MQACERHSASSDRQRLPRGNVFLNLFDRSLTLMSQQLRQKRSMRRFVNVGEHEQICGGSERLDRDAAVLTH
jgi:hypothetical protein